MLREKKEESRHIYSATQSTLSASKSFYYGDFLRQKWSFHSLIRMGSFSHVLAQSSLGLCKFLVSIASSCWTSQGPLPSGGFDPFSAVFVPHPSHSICGE